MKLIAALILVGGLVTACGGAGGPTLNVGDQKAGSEALLKAAGQLSGIKYKITWAQFTSGPPLLEAVNAGAVDIGAVGNTPPIFAAAAGSKISVVAATETPVTGQAILVPKNSTLTTLAGLRGKRIAVAKGSSAHYHLLAALRKAGLTFHDIKVSYLQPADALAAFTGGRIDAWAIWDPYTAQAQALGARLLTDGTGLVNGYGFEVAGRQAVKGKSAEIRDYLTRLQRAEAWANTHQEQWAKVWAAETGLPYSVTLVAVRRRATTPVPINTTLITSEQQVADAFGDAGLLPHRVIFKNFTDPRFNTIVPGGST
jgi:sulfonate transport system substrate-binding protein